MPKTFTTWTVLPHEPTEKIADNLWRVEGHLGTTQRQMVLARDAKGDVTVHNAIALDEPEMKALDAWGRVAVIFVPNGLHRQDARIWKDRYPEAKVVAPAGARKKIASIVPVDATCEDAPRDETLTLHALDGCPGEGVLEVHSGDDTTLVFCDALLNQPVRGGIWGFFLAPTGRPSVPRIVRWMGMKNRAALASHLDRLAATPGLRRVLVGHGKPIDVDPGAALRTAATDLRG